MAQAEPDALPLLSEVEAWDAELCRRHLSSALPRLLSVYQISDNWSQHICVLRILTEKFLPHINLDELEQVFLSKILPKTVQLFDQLMYEISNQAKRLTSQNVDSHLTLRNHLQAVGQLLEALTGCVRHICTKDMVPLEYIHSVPSSVLHVVKNTFIYCRDCESLYSDYLHFFSDLLQSLFKEAYVLQRQLMELLDTVSVDTCGPEDSLAIIVSVIHTVLEICSAISRIDQALHANTWKFIIRQSLKHKSLVKENLKHSDILSGLCEDILFSFQSSLQLAEQMKRSGTQESVDYKLFQRTVKLCRFFAISLVRYTKEFTPFLADSCSLLHQTYLQIYSKFPPSLYAPVISEAHKNEIVSGFLVALDPFVHQLLSFKPFVEVVLNKTLDLSPELQFPQCRLLLSVMDTLPSQSQDVQSLWNAGSQSPEEIPRVPLFVAFFLSLQQCSGELSLPVFLVDVTGPGQAEGPVTLYHYVCIHLCGFITSLSVLHFPLMESFLLETILGSNMITALLAMDAWCFLARYGTADLCAHHAFIIAHLACVEEQSKVLNALIKTCPAECFQISLLGFLLRRLLFLMAADNQVEFTQKYIPKEAENLLLWQHLSLKALEPLLRKQVAHDLFVAGLAQCQDWLSNKRPLEELPQVNFGLSALLSMCQTAGETLEEEEQTALIGTVGQLLTVLQDSQVSSLPCLQQTFSLMFQLLRFFIQKLQPQLVVQVIAMQMSVLQANPPDHVFFAVTEFLSSMGKLFIPSEFQVQVLSKLSCLFSSLLASNNWLIHQHALEAFTQFAEETSHEDILPQCLNSEEIKSKVVCFLSKTLQVEEIEEVRMERLKEESALLKCHLQKAVADEQRTLVLEPSPKRSCYSPNEVQYKSAIDTAEGTLETLKLLLQKGPPPTWLAKKLEVLQATLNSLRNSIS